MRHLRIALVLAVVAGLSAVPAATASAAPTGPPARAPLADPHTVTLVTGDVVRLDPGPRGRQRATVLHAADPRGGIHTFTSGGDVYVEPASAFPLLASGRLDEELFNVSGLVRQGYDDAHRDSVPLILSYQGTAAAPAAPAGTRSARPLAGARAQSVAAAKSQATQFWADLSRRPDIARVWLDAKVHATLDQSVPQIGAPAAWQRGFDGAGQKIAILDTGIDATHPDFAGRIDATQDFTGGGDVVDRAGHGTHVASIAAGSGAASDGRYRGVAPAAHLMIGKVLGDDGSGSESAVIDGMQWAASHGADVVNLSLGGPVTKGDDPLSQALDQLSAQYHTLFVVAAGNKSPGESGTNDVTSPGAARSALTVGSVTKTDRHFGNSRNGLMGDAYIKPDIAAPGVNITAAAAAQAAPPGLKYWSMTGTSQATPHVAGSVALLEQQHPTWGLDEIRAALTSTAAPIEGSSVFQDGAGRVDVDRATRQPVHVDNGLLSLGYFARPFDQAALHPSQTLTYTNDSDTPVTLHLTATKRLTVTPATLIIAAGAKEQAEVHADVSAAAPGEYSGGVTATDGSGLKIDTAVGFYKQDDMVDVTFRAVDRDGQPGTARVHVAPYLHLDGRYAPDNIYLTPAQREWTLRLPPDDYNVFGLIQTFDASGRFLVENSVVGNPDLKVRGPNFTVTLDARTARPMTLTTPHKSVPKYVTLDWSRGNPDNPLQTDDSVFWPQEGGSPTRLSMAPTQRVDDEQFSVTTNWDAGPPLLSATATGKPVDAVVTGGPLIDGKHRYRIVDAGLGRPKDLQRVDVRGAVALVQESTELPLDQQVRFTADAGAAVVALYSAQTGAFYPATGGPVPVISLPRAEGERLRLLAAGHQQLQLVGTARPDYAYDLTFVEKQRVGTDLTYQVAQHDLAEVRTRIHTSGTGELGAFYHQRTFAGCECSADPLAAYVPATGYLRTEYVTARPDVVDYAGWQYWVNGLPVHIVRPRAGRSFAPGEKVTKDWLKAPYSPGVYNSTNHDERLISRRAADDAIWYNLAGFTDSAGNWSQELIGLTERSALYLGDKLLYSNDSLLSGTATVPATAETYRLVTDVDNDGSLVGLSTHAHTEWTFRSAAADGVETPLPLVDVDYPNVVDAANGHDALDLANMAQLSKRVTLQLSTSHLRGSDAPPVDHLAVWVSYDDGQSWQPAGVRSAGNGAFEATYQHPARGQFVSLRVSATDGAGNGMDQTLIRAYRLG